jgi:hypothetical protein
VLRSAIVVRVAPLLMAGGSLPFVAGRFASVWQPLLPYAAMAAETAAVVVWWVRLERMTLPLLVVELTTGAGLMLADGWLIGDADVSTWALFVYPYTVMVTFAVGLMCRRLAWSVAVGVGWLTCYVVVCSAMHGEPVPVALFGTPTYLANPVVGWLSARVFRRNARELDDVHEAAIARAADLAAQRVRARSAWALHDRVLQTLETLARGDQVTAPALRERVVTEAAWLRAFVESDGAQQEHDLTVGLDTVARMARRQGLGVEVNYAAFLSDGGAVVLSTPQRIALVEATHEVLAGMTGVCDDVVVQARPADGGVVISVLATADGSLAAVDVDAVADCLTRVGGRVLVADATPYVEFWVPAQTGG